jgi:cytosine deaminase
MRQPISLELLAFNLKLIGQGTRKRILVSAGKVADKQQLLPALRRLMALNVELYATPGTHQFLRQASVPAVEIYKIADERAPNILTFLKANRFDLVVNILTGDDDYDEASDAKLIRSRSIENAIPLITDPQVAIATLEQIIVDNERGTYRYKLADDSEPWNLHLHFLQKVSDLGGMACHHAHFDKSYLITMDNLRLSQVDMQRKWELYRFLKENYTPGDLTERISRAVERMIAQGVTYCRTMVDADSTVKLLPIEAAMKVKAKYAGRIRLEVGVQPLQGVLDPESRAFFEKACELADFIGGLPSRDRPQEEKHLDTIMTLARRLGKPIDVHIDQENNPLENETELLARKTIEHGLQGKVFGIHAISLAAKPPAEQDRIIELVKTAGMSIVICPSAALSMKPLEMTAPIHNAIAPLHRLLAAGVPCYLGVDNIHDLFMPLVDGDMWFECRLMMEACRFYDIEKVAELACLRPPHLLS